MRHIQLPEEKMKNITFTVKRKITEELIEENSPLKCPNCGNIELKVFDKLHDDKMGFVKYKCKKCHHNLQITFSKWDIWMHNLIIIMVSKISPIENRKNEIATINCKFCDGTYKSIHQIENEFIASHVIMCKKCKRKIIISYEKLYYVPYKNLLNKAIKISDHVPEMVFVLCASALEIYFKYSIEYHSALVKYMIDSRKLNLQDLDSTKKVFKEGFHIDIVKLDEKNWSSINSIFKKRNNIIHNGGFDKEGNLITSTTDEAMEIIKIINEFVILIEKEFIKDPEERNGCIARK